MGDRFFRDAVSVRNNRRHILLACNAWYGDLIGGSFRLASEFAADLAAAGHRVSYVCCSQPGTTEPLAKDVADGVNIYRYQGAQKSSGLRRLQFHIQQTRKIVRRVHQENRIDIISGHSPLQALGAATAIRADFNNYTVHSPFDDELMSNISDGRPSLLMRAAVTAAKWVDRRNIRLADRVQTVSRYTLGQLIKKYGSSLSEKGTVSPGWVEAKLFQPAADRTALRQHLGFPWNTGSPLFFTLRRLENRMGLDTLIDACKLLQEEGQPFRVLIGGSGSLQNVLKDRIHELGLDQYVSLLGRLPEEILPQAYAAADCFVLPTRALECFGLIVLESFACNTPVIASSAAAIPELAAQQGAEWLFPPGDPVALSQCMKRFIIREMTPAVSLREIALRYDRPRIFEEWERLLMDHPSK